MAVAIIGGGLLHARVGAGGRGQGCCAGVCVVVGCLLAFLLVCACDMCASSSRNLSEDQQVFVAGQG